MKREFIFGKSGHIYKSDSSEGPLENQFVSFTETIFVILTEGDLEAVLRLNKLTGIPFFETELSYDILEVEDLVYEVL